MSKTATLRVHYAFLYISLLSLHNYDVKLNDQILSLLENGNGEAINSTWTLSELGRGPFSSAPTKIPFF